MTTSALPNVEVVYVSAEDFLTAHFDTWQASYMADAMDACPEHDLQAAEELAGWYYWHSDSDPIGPFETEQEALKHAKRLHKHGVT